MPLTSCGVAGAERRQRMRELFIDELTEIRGGFHGGPHASTEACCEETPFGCCGWWERIEDLIKQ